MPGGTVSGVTTFVSVAAPQAASSSTNTLNAMTRRTSRRTRYPTAVVGRPAVAPTAQPPKPDVFAGVCPGYVNQEPYGDPGQPPERPHRGDDLVQPAAGRIAQRRAGGDRYGDARPGRAGASIHGNFQGSAQVFAQSLAAIPLLILAAPIAVYIVLGILYEEYHPSADPFCRQLPSAGIGATLALLLFDGRSR